MRSSKIGAVLLLLLFLTYDEVAHQGFAQNTTTTTTEANTTTTTTAVTSTSTTVAPATTPAPPTETAAPAPTTPRPTSASEVCDPSCRVNLYFTSFLQTSSFVQAVLFAVQNAAGVPTSRFTLASRNGYYGSAFGNGTVVEVTVMSFPAGSCNEWSNDAACVQLVNSTVPPNRNSFLIGVNVANASMVPPDAVLPTFGALGTISGTFLAAYIGVGLAYVLFAAFNIYKFVQSYQLARAERLREEAEAAGMTVEEMESKRQSEKDQQDKPAPPPSAARGRGGRGGRGRGGRGRGGRAGGPPEAMNNDEEQDRAPLTVPVVIEETDADIEGNKTLEALVRRMVYRRQVGGTSTHPSMLYPHVTLEARVSDSLMRELDQLQLPAPQKGEEEMEAESRMVERMRNVLQDEAEGGDEGLADTAADVGEYSNDGGHDGDPLYRRQTGPTDQHLDDML